MTLVFVMVPLMVAAVAIATVPILYHSVREHRLIHGGSARKVRAPAAAGYSIRRVPPPERSVDHQEVAA